MRKNWIPIMCVRTWMTSLFRCPNKYISFNHFISVLSYKMHRYCYVVVKNYFWNQMLFRITWQSLGTKIKHIKMRNQKSIIFISLYTIWFDNVTMIYYYWPMAVLFDVQFVDSKNDLIMEKLLFHSNLHHLFYFSKTS